MCILFLGFNWFSASVIVWKTHFESISVPNHSQEIAFRGIVEGNSFRKAHALLETSDVHQNFIKIVTTVPVQTFTESETRDGDPHLTLVCLRDVSWLCWAVETVQWDLAWKSRDILIYFWPDFKLSMRNRV